MGYIFNRPDQGQSTTDPNQDRYITNDPNQDRFVTNEPDQENDNNPVDGGGNDQHLFINGPDGWIRYPTSDIGGADNTVMDDVKVASIEDVFGTYDSYTMDMAGTFPDFSDMQVTIV